MNTKTPPLLIEPDELKQHLGSKHILVIDLSPMETHKAYHVPGAVHLDYADLTQNVTTTPGSFPEDSQISQALNQIGLTPKHHVIAYDDSDNSKACRLLWTLDLLGLSSYSLLDGGLQTWLDEKYPIDSHTSVPARTTTTFSCIDEPPAVDLLYILQHLNDKNTRLLDVRTPEEYKGEEIRSTRGGHIPGAINLDHRLLLDPEHSNRLKPKAELGALIKNTGLTPKQEIITYCHSHRRSALAYFVLKHLGFPHVKAYPGGWAEWGNNLDTPIE